jgi:hypothetical protein
LTNGVPVSIAAAGVKGSVDLPLAERHRASTVRTPDLKEVVALVLSGHRDGVGGITGTTNADTEYLYRPSQLGEAVLGVLAFNLYLYPVRLPFDLHLMASLCHWFTTLSFTTILFWTSTKSTIEPPKVLLLHPANP